jgi:hypothetical protein
VHRSRPSRLVRGSLFAAAAAITLVTLSTAAGAHAGFKAYSAFGFAPNPTGGSNAASGDQATPPYSAATTVTMSMRAAVEVPTGQSWDPALYSNVRVDIIVPTGWTNPTCGTANLQVNDASTGNTNQPGAAVAGWSCTLTNDGAGHQLLRYTGPAVAQGGLQSDAAQYFIFTVTTPSPMVDTTYGVGGTEGFIADQYYADSNVSHWYPSTDYVGTYPAGGQPTTPAAGLLRTVAAVTTPTTATPDPVSPAFTG